MSLSNPPPPPRKFAPTPIETTSKSSRQHEAPKEDTKPKPRRFAPEPVEHSVKSSKDADRKESEGQDEKSKPRRFAPQIVEESHKSSEGKNEEVEKPEPRRFAPQVIEESHKSSKGNDEDAKKPKPRRFAPEVVEESQKSSKDKQETEKKTHVKFKPEPISTSYGGNRKAKDGDAPSAEAKTRRKFAPILLDTAQRSRRSQDSQSSVSESDDAEPRHHQRKKNAARHHTPGTSSEGDSEEAGHDSDRTASPEPDHDRTSDLRREVSPLDGSAPKRPSCLAQKRTHSFRMPHLDTIESSESERASAPPSPSSTPDAAGSPITASDSSYEVVRHATRRRESADDNFTHYLLEVERKKAKERLEEQALAAFPNADFGYEPPHHYVNNDSDSDDVEIEDRPGTWEGHEDDLMMETKARRQSSVEMSWEQKEAQKHAEEAQRERNAMRLTAPKQPSQSPWWNPGAGLADTEVDKELKSMRDRARPPMLGRDLVFPRCPSPEPARFDVTQGSSHLRNQMCYLTEHAESERKRSGEDGGLWQARQPESKRVNVIESRPNSPKNSIAKGLWGGFCHDDGEADSATSTGLAVPLRPTGLMTPRSQTPRAELPNPFERSLPSQRIETPPTPPSVSGRTSPALNKEAIDLKRIDSVLVTERELDAMMEREFPDSFITQVFNYLSLGYPSLARPFDEELSKISRFSIAELRRDDQVAKNSPRGYIRLGPDFEAGNPVPSNGVPGGAGGVPGGELTEDNCMRWQALKRYVREWARQEKNMVKVDAPGGYWGTGARRGSWAI